MPYSRDVSASHESVAGGNSSVRTTNRTNSAVLGSNSSVVVSAEVSIPDQSRIMRSYKRRLLRMQAAQRDIHGGFKINVEAQIAQEQLVKTLQNVVSSSLKVCQFSLVAGLRTSQPIRNSREREEAERILDDRRQRIRSE